MYLLIEVVLIGGADLVAISAVVAVLRNSESGIRRQKAQRGGRNGPGKTAFDFDRSR
jgi:hypothetical protein